MIDLAEQSVLPEQAGWRHHSSLGSLWQRLTHGGWRWRERADWLGYAGEDWAERIMTAPLTDDIHVKQGRSTGRWALEKSGRVLSVYVKRHHRLPWWRGALSLLWPWRDWSPALHECRGLEWAAAQGFAVPRVVAAGEGLKPWGRLQSFLIVEELVGMLPLHLAIPQAKERLDAALFTRWKSGLVKEIARLTRALHGRRQFHKDLYLCHFYIARADTWSLPRWQGRVHWIDWQRLGRHFFTAPYRRIKDLAQLLYSSAVEGVSARDRLRFWRFYLHPEGKKTRTPFLEWCVRGKAQRYRRHNEKRK